MARELTPSQTAQMNKQNVRGFVTEKAARPHTAIIAEHEIPAVVGIGDITSLVRDGDFLIIDGNDGTVYVNRMKA